MAKDERGLLDVLRAELKFIEKGGYRHSARAAWRPHFMFQDSPILAQLVPENARVRKIPCRYIPLNERGETIDSYYRAGTQEELEAAVVEWLKATIKRLERKSAQAPPTEETPQVHVRAKFVSVE
jgi:hypothetical protein